MNRELETAIRLARGAGELALAVQRGEFEVVEKANDEGPVTIADRRADRHIREGLHAAFPGDALLTEETPDDLSRLAARRVWIVDPLDGTKQFVQRAGEFAVMIGLAVEGRAALGVVHLPADGRTFAGAVGEGTYEILKDAAPRRIVLPEMPDVEGRLILALSRNRAGARTARLVEELAPNAVVVSGSVGRKAALVLAGRADAYVSLGKRSRHWDACAPDALITAAGGFFGDAYGREKIYNTAETQNTTGLLACRRGLVARIARAANAALAASRAGKKP